jgi:hypothetical protein
VAFVNNNWPLDPVLVNVSIKRCYKYLSIFVIHRIQMRSPKIDETLKNTLNDFLKFPMSEAIAGRRAKRFCLGAEIPDGAPKHDPLPLSEIEQLLLLSYMGGVTGWHFAIMRHERYAPKLSNYSASPVGRTFPSAAGFITSELFYTDDSGTYIFPTRDFHPEIEINDGTVDLEDFHKVLLYRHIC